MKSLRFGASASVVMFAVVLAGCGAGAQMATQNCYVNGHESNGACYCFPVGSSCTISYHSITPGHILQVPAPPVQPGAGPMTAAAQTRGRSRR